MRRAIGLALALCVGLGLARAWADFYQDPNAVVNSNVQATATTTAADGSWTVSWNTPFNSASPLVNAFAMIAPGATQPITCNTTARTSTTASGKCFLSQTTILSLSIITTGLTLNPSTIPPSGTTLQVFGRNPTQ